MNRVAPIPASVIAELSNKNLTVSRSKDIHKKIEKRFEYVLLTTMDIIQWGVEWFAFDNHTGEGDFGSFLPGKYKKNIAYDGSFFARETNNEDENVFLHDFVDKYARIPTRWLSENFEADLSAEFKEAKRKVLEQSKAKNDVVSKLQDSIKSKLTKAELAQIRFNVVLPTTSGNKTTPKKTTKPKAKPKKI